MSRIIEAQTIHRRYIVSLCITLIAFFALALVRQPPLSMAQAADTSQFDANNRPAVLLIGFQSNTSLEELSALLAQEGMYIEQVWPALNLVEAHLDLATLAATDEISTASATATAQSTLASSPLVRYVTPDARVEIAAYPTDPFVSQQWSIAATNVVEGWEISRGDPSVAIAILDTGFTFNHEDLSTDSLWINTAEQNGQPGIDDDLNGLIDDVHGWDWIERDAVANDEHGHGTHVSGLIVATTNNGIGIAGHGQQLRIAPLRVLDASGTGFISTLVAGLDYAREQGFPIINLSLTVNSDSPALHDAIKAAHDAGSIVVAATGNRSSGVQWPALYDETVGVAATASDNDRWAFSNFGAKVDIAAPGAAILSTYIDLPTCASPCTAYRTQSGTSMATPLVSALAGFIMSLRPDLSPSETIALMKESAADLNADQYPGPDIYLGAGSIDYASALLEATAALTITSELQTPFLVQKDAVIDLPMRVLLSNTEQIWNIPGAVISHSLTLTDGTPASVSSVAVSDADGVANLSVTVPVSEGTYLLNSSLGLITTTTTLIARDLSFTATLSASSLTTTVDGPDIPFTVTIHDPQEVLTDVVAPLKLSTNLGSIQDGAETKVVYLANNIYEGVLKPGTVAGEALLTATIANVTESVSITVQAGMPATITNLAENSSGPITAGQALSFGFLVSDAYGNAVSDGTEVVVTSSVGLDEPRTLFTLDGMIETTFTLPLGASGPLIVGVTLPNTSLTHAYEVAIEHQYFVPALFADRDMSE